MVTRSTRNVLHQIQFKMGLLSPINDFEADEEADESMCVLSYTVSVMRYEERLARLPVLSEEGPFQVEVGDRVELSVGTDQAFVTVVGEVASIEKTREGREALYLELHEVDALQRRVDDRFQSRTITRFTPLDEWKDKVHLGITGQGHGQAMDLSLGGMQILTEADLPNGYEAMFKIQISGGTLWVKGRVVRRHLRTRMGTTYGIKFIEYDRITSRLLHQFILSERRKSRSAQGTVAHEERVRLSRRRWDR